MKQYERNRAFIAINLFGYTEIVKINHLGERNYESQTKKDNSHGHHHSISSHIVQLQKLTKNTSMRVSSRLFFLPSTPM